MSDDNWDDEQNENNLASSHCDNGTNFGMGRGLPQKKNYESPNMNRTNSGYTNVDNKSNNDRRPGAGDYGKSYDDRHYDKNHGNNSGYEDGENPFNIGSSYNTDNNENQYQAKGNYKGYGNNDQYNGYNNQRGRSRGGGRFDNNNRYDENSGSRGGDRNGTRTGMRSYRGNNDDNERYRGGGFRNSGDGDFKGFRQNDDRKETGYHGCQDGENNDRPERPRQTYIPPEHFDENTVYGSGVKVGINFSNYNNIEVNTTGRDIPPPIKSFKEGSFRRLLQDNIEKSNYKMPTPVQKYAFSILMANRDLMACAQTGSGKTAAFMIPIVNKLLEKTRDSFNSGFIAEPRAVIIAPTRELTTQIYNQARKFANHSMIKCQQLYGGTSVSYQLKNVLSGCDILVATPGRLLDFVKRGKLNFQAVEFLVLDEADKMLDMGFSDDVEKIFRHETMMPTGERQTLMFSATFPPRIQELAAKYMNNYIFVSVGVIGGACTDIEQTFFEVSKKDKRNKLNEILRIEEEHNKLCGILVFVDMKKTADFIAAFLSENNFPTTSIHGDRMQREREEALHDFKTGKMAILVATAVAARGLDIENVSHVINYDLPKDIDEYVHRIGRTGRVGNKGKATSFYDESVDHRIQKELVKVLTVSGQNVPEWLCDSNNYNDYEPALGFGGRDIRSFSDIQSFPQSGTQPIENDEQWET